MVTILTPLSSIHGTLSCWTIQTSALSYSEQIYLTGGDQMSHGVYTIQSFHSHQPQVLTCYSTCLCFCACLHTPVIPLVWNIRYQDWSDRPVCSQTSSVCWFHSLDHCIGSFIFFWQKWNSVRLSAAKCHFVMLLWSLCIYLELSALMFYKIYQASEVKRKLIIYPI